MRTIHKHPLPERRGFFDLQLPRGAALLAAAPQKGRGMLWVLVETTQSPTTRRFFIAVTGGEVPDDVPLRHVGTMEVGPYASGMEVIHLFEQPLEHHP